MTDFAQTIEKSLRRDLVRTMITDPHGRLLDIRTAVFLYNTAGQLHTVVSPKTWESLSAAGKLDMHGAGVRIAIGIDGELQPITDVEDHLARPLLGRKVRTEHGLVTYVIERVAEHGWTLRALSGEKKERFVPNEKTGTLVFIE